MPAPSLSPLSTLGACPTCGHERLMVLEATPQGLGVGARYRVDCGGCPVVRVEVVGPPTLEPWPDWL